MKTKIIIGDKVQWKWMGHFIKGVVKEIFLEPVSKQIKGKVIKRNGSQENPALLVQSEAGNLALKLQSELQKQNKQKTRSTKPQLFSI